MTEIRTLTGARRGRIDGDAAVARRCDDGIVARLIELERALRLVDATSGGADEAADDAIRIAVELDALERVQPGIDSWLRVATGAPCDAPEPTPFGDGPS
jgi:hypothetical protein